MENEGTKPTSNGGQDLNEFNELDAPDGPDGHGGTDEHGQRSEMASDSTAAASSSRSLQRLVPRRSATDRYLGGVAGGIAEKFATDPFAPRAAFLGATLFAAYAADWVPIVPLAYTVLWLLLPGPTGSSVLRTIRQRSSVRQAVAALATFGLISLLLTRPIFGFALVLAAVAWVLLSDEAPRFPGAEATQLRSATPSTPQTEAEHQLTRSLWGRRRRAERGEEVVAEFRRIAAKPRREPALWPLAISLLAIVAVGSVIADSQLSGGLDPAIAVNLALVVIGVVVCISAWRGRAGWIAVIALALLPAWIGFSVADIGRFEDAGASQRPTELPASGQLNYQSGYGAMTIDLRDLPLADGDDVSVQISATAGAVKVYAPFDTDVVLHSKVGFGTTEVRGHGLNFFEYDREPHLDRSIVRRYGAHGSGCISEYWSSWDLLVTKHQTAGVDLTDFAVDSEADIEPILRAIVEAGFEAPTPVDDPVSIGPINSRGGPFTVLDQFGNEVGMVADLPAEMPSFEMESEALGQTVANRTWSYSADVNGQPCVATPPSDNPATIEIEATVGVGTLEVLRDEF